MPSGGKRTGAGRPKGSTSRLTQAAIKRAERLEAKGLQTPLEYMLHVMNDARADPDRRDRMAMGAAPYMHARLSSVSVQNSGDGPVVVIDNSMTLQEMASAYDELIQSENRQLKLIENGNVIEGDFSRVG